MIAQSTSATRADRIAGTMFGAAIGDALGSAFEMVSNETIERALGSAFASDFRAALRGSLLYPRAAGKPTDDTAMALSLAFALSCGEPFDAALFAERFLADLDRTNGEFATMFWDGGPGGATTSLPPLSNGAQISSVDASNATGASCRKVSCGPSSAKSVFFTRRITPRCVTATPLGLPVEPDV